MIIFVVLLLFDIGIMNGMHFNGGTIRWEPVDPNDNSSSVAITIIQTYAWTYPNIICAINVPITSSGRSTSNTNLTCIADCSTDGGYSAKPIDILTDCVSVSPALSMLTSQRAKNITLNAGAHFYVSYMGSAWIALNDPPVGGHQWSITSFIDLRMRPDGIINTSPVASVVSPQYAIVNRTMQIQIPVSDANPGDDIRCRWSTYTPGYRRKKRSDEERDINYEHATTTYNSVVTNKEVLQIRKRRGDKQPPDPCAKCNSQCWSGCPCSCSICSGTNCGTKTCGAKGKDSYCPATTTVFGVTVTIPTSTSETPGTLASTLSYPTQQAIDECGGICYPSSVPAGTTLSNCTISFLGLTAGIWYGVSVQVNKDLVIFFDY